MWFRILWKKRLLFHSRVLPQSYSRVPTHGLTPGSHPMVPSQGPIPRSHPMVPPNGTTPWYHASIAPHGSTPGSRVLGSTPGSWSHFFGMPPRGEASTNEASESLRRVLYWHGFTVTKSLLTALFDFILPVMCIFCFGYWPAWLFDYLTIHIRLLTITITEFWFAELFWFFSLDLQGVPTYLVC